MTGDSPPPLGGRYALAATLGRGGMGEVYLGRDLHLDRPVAVKVLRGDRRGPELANAADRFAYEGRLAGRQAHPALVPLLDADLAGPTPYLVFEYLAGGDLAGEIAAGPAEPARVARVGARLAGALAALHERGVLHRDVKPANVLLDAEGETFLADLGLARDADREALTRTGMVVGTPAYMAPEVLEQAAYSEASDAFALGITLLELATGIPAAVPGRGGPEAVGDLLPPGALRAVLHRLTRRHASVRLADLAEVATLLGEIETSEDRRTHPGQRAPVRAVADASTFVGPPGRRGTGGATADRPGRGRLVAGSATLALALLLALAGPRASVSPPPRAGPSAAPIPGAVEDPLVLLASRVREELNDLQGLRVRDALPVGASPDPRLDDALIGEGPGTWPLVRARLPSLEVLVAEVRSRHAAFPLGPEALATLERTDEALSRQSFPALLVPMAGATPAPGPRPPPKWCRVLVERTFPGLTSPPSVGPWTVAAIKAVYRAHRGYIEKHRAYGEVGDGVPPALREARRFSPVFGGGNLEGLLTGGGIAPALRRAAWAWLAPDAALLRRGLATAALALDRHPPDRPFLALALQTILRESTRSLFGSLLLEDPLTHLLPPGERSSARALLELRILTNQAFYTREAERLVSDSEAARLDDLEARLASIGTSLPAGPPGLPGWIWAVGDAAQVCFMHGRTRSFPALARIASALPPGPRGRVPRLRYLALLGAGCLREPGGSSHAREIAAALEAEADGLPAALDSLEREPWNARPDASSPRELLALLRRDP